MKPPGLPTSTAAIAAFGAVLVQVPVARLINAFTAPAANGDVTAPADGTGTLLLYSLLPTLVSITWIWFFAIWREPGGWARVGIRPGNGNWARNAALTGVATVVIGLLVVNLTTPILGQPHGPGLPVPLNDPDANGLYLLTVVVGAVLVAPVFEELVFRGIIYGWLRRYLGAVPASVIAAVPHAAIHFDVATIPALSVIFVIYAFVYERTGTLKASILTHCVHNAFVLTIAFASM